ncbi:hypothetical protein T440DRAFT_469482 [Plenodomus tracheiphilus IPT5]|uniref:VOC domain-containing protein n=1 Tax=Plenodomus tracheiphilus IPT5 TaxID=1408161 RepID=A0A6A7B1M8_9PLEO|nr:hypothetical protein T440DRAFT_469482 [Plenodomus tracheiphilus IPT5]
MLRIKSPEKSLKFYCDCMGMVCLPPSPLPIVPSIQQRRSRRRRTKKNSPRNRNRNNFQLTLLLSPVKQHIIFIFNAGPWTIYYLGPRNVDISSIGTASGLLELYHIPADAASTPYVSGNEYDAPGGGVGFGHIGFTVPDVGETVDRVKELGYEVIKPLGEAGVAQMGLPREIVGGGEGVVAEGYKGVFRQLAFVRDPDVSVCLFLFGSGRSLVVLMWCGRYVFFKGGGMAG